MKTFKILIAVAGVGLAASPAALVSRRKFPKAATPLAVVTLLAARATLGLGGWIRKAGGQIHRPEFRGAGMPPAADEPHHHGAKTNSETNNK